MATTATPSATPATGSLPSPKEQFLNAYDREHAITMRVLRAYPPDKASLQPHPKCKTAQQLAWMFVLERGLGTKVFADGLASGGPMGEMPKPPESWDDLLAAVDDSHQKFGDLVRATSDAQLSEKVKFFTAPKTLGDVGRLEFAWFLLSDEIHHRGQLSVYLRMADGKVPSIYGPTADEPWM